MTTFAEFYRDSQEIVAQQDRQGSYYFEPHTLRFFHTYQLCVELLKNTEKRVLSVGAGSAYVEFQLQRQMDASIAVVDFSRALTYHLELYLQHNFTVMSFDLADKWDYPGDDQFDLILCGEIVEHLPIPPVKHFQDLVRYLAPGGHLLVTTPNLARLATLARLVRGKPIMDDPVKTFHPAHFSHEHIHRREYVAMEIQSAMEQAGLMYQFTQYTRNKRINKWTPRKVFVNAIETLSPHLKETLMVVGKKCED